MTVNVFWLCDRWHMAGDMWHLTPDTSHLTPHTWHLTPDMWHLTCDTWHVTPDMWHLTHGFFLSFFYNFFEDFVMSVLLTKQAKKFSVSHICGTFVAWRGARKNHWIRKHAHTSLRPTPYCDRLRLLSFGAVFGLFGILGML